MARESVTNQELARMHELIPDQKASDQPPPAKKIHNVNKSSKTNIPFHHHKSKDDKHYGRLHPVHAEVFTDERSKIDTDIKKDYKYFNMELRAMNATHTKINLKNEDIFSPTE